MAPHISGSQSSLREANKALLSDAITKYGAMTQVELAENTGLSTATVSILVRQLVDDGLFTTTDTVRSGRRATLVSIARKMGIGVGVAIERHSLSICVTDFSLTVLAEHSMPLAFGHKPDSTLIQAARLIHETIDSIGAQIDEIASIMVAIAAPVDWKHQQIGVRRILPDWDDIDVVAHFKNSFHCAIFIDNDANAAAIAEHKQGVAANLSNFLYVHAGDGVGSAMFINNDIYRGSMGLAGEIGHVQVDPFGDICVCGNRGCLDTVVSEQRLTQVLSFTHGSITLDDLIQGALNSDAGCRRVISDAAVRIGTVVAQTCISMDPQSIVVGGTLTKARDIFLEPLQQSVQRLLFPDAVAPIRIISSDNPENNVALGAALASIELAPSVSI
ncbi:ROK family transcriptional regulator [Alloscardovia sp. HMSC034E08]|uniref:ROK family transcriptional regulator n=1 Tax=Alloscardovia sp. HMSC034E08 TaxID=1739413 RepID=UPI0008D2BEF2|nr:ROK family transcriptional regulator [Alloscardovia sp. HMSC034E08]OFQ99331.1 NagC family transcriptional regulator [Alloscardovia sp. HMSC034E08]